MANKQWFEILKAVESIKLYVDNDGIFYAEVYHIKYKNRRDLSPNFGYFFADSWELLIKDVYNWIF